MSRYAHRKRGWNNQLGSVPVGSNAKKHDGTENGQPRKPGIHMSKEKLYALYQ
jgi:hypothetical protein